MSTPNPNTKAPVPDPARSPGETRMQRVMTPVYALRTRLSRWRSQRPWLFWSAATIGLPGGLVLASVLTLLVLVWAGACGALPTEGQLRELKLAEASQLLDRDGELLARYFEENRDLVALGKLPACLTDALVATEDARFLEHGGVDFRATARALVMSGLLGREEQGGGSTLSQQLAKNLYPRRGTSTRALVVAKTREAFIARRLERAFAKDQVLELYLNTVPFGDNVYGIRRASLRYFGVEPGRLRCEQAATLVGMLKANESYHPIRHPERSLARRNTVLRRMRDQGKLSDEDYATLTEKPLGVRPRDLKQAGVRPTHLSARVRREVESLLVELRDTDGETYNLDRDGLRVVTTIEKASQDQAERALRGHLGALQVSLRREWRGREVASVERRVDEVARASRRWRGLLAAGHDEAEAERRMRQRRRVTYTEHSALGYQSLSGSSWRDSIRYELLRLRAGLVAVDPRTGEVVAYVGGDDYAAVPFDAVGARRQVGSTFKPILYAAALEAGAAPCDYYDAAQANYGSGADTWTPNNPDGDYEGQYSLTGSLVNSVNTVAAALIDETGERRVRRMAAGLGIEGLPEGPAIALGTGSATLLEMVRAYAAFHNRGRVPDLRLVDRIEDAGGRILYAAPRADTTRWREAFGPETGAALDYMLRQVATRGTASGLRSRHGVRSEVAAKTGTTQDQADGWLLGYVEGLAVGAWVGGAYPDVRWQTLSSGQGARTALPIVGRFLAARERRVGRKALPPLPEEFAEAMDCPDRRQTPPERGPFAGVGEWLEGVFGPGRPEGAAGRRERNRSQERRGRDDPSRVREREAENERVRRRREQAQESQDRGVGRFLRRVFGNEPEE